jgi:hypothetical protein
VDVASGMGALPASRRAAAIISAVRRAVPEGASALSGWCSSTTSTDSKKGAACAAKRIIRMAPMEKLGAISTPTSGASASQASSWSSRGWSKPVVPTTAWMPCSMQKRRLSITTSGWVKSTTTSAPARASSSTSSPASTEATSSVSGAASTARHTSEPTLPRAPSTPTRTRARTCPSSPLLTRSTVSATRIGVWRWLTREQASGRLWPMPASTIPPRIKWAVDLMDVQPADQVLEIGCGPGAGAEAICAKLETGKLFAIDRSESGVDRTKRRNQKYVDAGRLVVRQIDLATLRVPVKRLNKVFAFNVNLFWVRACDDEVALLHERVVPGGAVYLFYEAARPELVPNIVKKASENLLRGGFRVSVVEQKAPPVIGIIARR